MTLLNKLKNNVLNRILNSDIVINFINTQSQRYATVQNINLHDGVIKFTVTPKGLQKSVIVTASEFSFAHDNSSLFIGKFTANMPWVENALKDFVQGKKFSIPKDKRRIIGNIKAFI